MDYILARAGWHPPHTAVGDTHLSFPPAPTPAPKDEEGDVEGTDTAKDSPNIGAEPLQEKDETQGTSVVFGCCWRLGMHIEGASIDLGRHA